MNHNYQLDINPFTTHTMLLAEVPNDANVLEIGTASGYLGRYLIKNKSCVVSGVEPFEGAYNHAVSCGYRKIVNKSAEQTIANDDFVGEKFDVILLADVLEHLVDPTQVLRDLKKYLKPDGRIVISLPNVAYFEVRLSLLFGRWNMTEAGILDKTHLHFFTMNTARDLIVNSGLVVEKCRPLSGTFERFGYNKLFRIGQKLLFMFPKLFAYQILLVARLD